MSNLKKPASPEAQAMGRRGGKAQKRPIKFSISELAEAVGKSVVAVQRDRQRGKFDQKDLKSIAKYISMCSERGA